MAVTVGAHVPDSSVNVVQIPWSESTFLFLKALFDPWSPPCSPKTSKKCRPGHTLRTSPQPKEPGSEYADHPDLPPPFHEAADPCSLTAAKLPSRIKLQSQGRWPCNSSLAVSTSLPSSLSIRNQETFFFFEHFKKQQLINNKP